MIKAELNYSITCDKCGKNIEAYSENVAWLTKELITLERDPGEIKFQQIGGKWYCEKCYTVNDETGEYEVKDAIRI